jgi:uncharacterized repeat protein (TIGR02543 family)
MPASNVSVTAQWTINQYTIAFDSDGGTSVATETNDYNSVVVAPADPTKTGYTFAGWNPSLPANMPASNVSVTAQWTINQYTIAFDSDGGTSVATSCRPDQGRVYIPGLESAIAGNDASIERVSDSAVDGRAVHDDRGKCLWCSFAAGHEHIRMERCCKCKHDYTHRAGWW